MGKKMKVFYRYLRPVKFDTRRLEFDTLSSGGVCLRFEEDLDGTLWFTHARCHPNDHFNKKVAKRIADERAAEVRLDPRLKAACGGLAYTKNTEELAVAVANHCEFWVPPEGTHEVVSFYLSIEWHGLSDVIERILRSNDLQRRIGGIWITAAHAGAAMQMYKDTSEV